MKNLVFRSSLVPLIEKIQSESIRVPLLGVVQGDKTKGHVYYWPASIKYHHCHEGGWSDHTAQVMRNGVLLYETYNPELRFDFTLDDVLLCCFGHDFDKITRYRELSPENKWKSQPKYGSHRWEYNEDNKNLRHESKAVAMLFRIGVALTDEQIEAIDHAEGGWSSDLSSVYAHGGGGMTKLATLVHCADLISGFCMGTLVPEGLDARSS